MALTDTEIKKSKIKEKAYRLSDSGGLFCWITPAGGKLWRWAYRHEGKEKLMSFGKYPDIALKNARGLLPGLKKLLHDGIDPSFERMEKKYAVAFFRISTSIFKLAFSRRRRFTLLAKPPR